MGGFTDFLNDTLPPEAGKKSGFLGFLDMFTKDEPTQKSELIAQKIEQAAPKTGFTAFLEEELPPDYGTKNWALRENVKTIPAPQTEEYVDYNAPKPLSEPLPPLGGGRVPFMRQPTEVERRFPDVVNRALLSPLTLGLSDIAYGERGLPQGPIEKGLASGLKFAGFMATPVKLGGVAGKLAGKGVAKVLGEKLAPTLMGEALQLGASRGVSLGTAGVLQDLAHIKSGKEALDTFKTYAIMGEIFGLAGMAHLPKHPVMSQIIRQVGGRVLLGDKLSKESLSPENIGQTTFNELLNTFFLAHGEPPAKVFSGGIAHGKAVRFIEGMEEKPTPEEVRAAGGPAKWLGKALTELTEAAKPVAEMAKAEAPEVLYSQERPKEEEQLAIPGVVPPPKRPEPFKPEELGGRQGVLPMPDAAPLFAGKEAKPKPPDTLFYSANELVGLPAGLGRETGSERFERGKERAAKPGSVVGAKKKGPGVSEKEAFERKAVDEAVAAIKEGATTYDALDPVYRPLLEKYLDPETLHLVSEGKAGQQRGRLVMPTEPPPEVVAKAAEVTPPPPSEAEVPLGRAPKTLPELQSEIVRINEGRVSTDQAAALGALVKGVARYRGMTPDEYVAGRFAGLEAGEAPPEKPFFGRESTAQFIRDLNKRGITDPKMVEKILNGEPIAAVEFLEDGKAVLRAFRKSNIAGMAHELGHVFRRDLSPAESSLVERACGVRNGKWDRYSEEQWAKQFELYLKRGKAPNPELEGVFAKFKKWLGVIYQDMKAAFGPQHRIHPNVTRVLDKVLGGVEIQPDNAVGRVTKTVGQEAVPALGTVGPTIGNVPETPNNPVVMRANKKTNQGVGITLDLVKQRNIQLGKHPLTPMAEQVDKIPLVKEHIMDPLHEAQTNVARGYGEAVQKINTWKKSLPPNAGKRILAYAYSRQPGTEILLQSLGFKEAPKLTDGEMIAYQTMRADFERFFPLINNARAYLGNNPIGKIPDYFMVARQLTEVESVGHDLILDPDGRALTERLKKTPEPGFLKKRGAWSDLPLQEDAFHIYEYYVRKALQYIEYSRPVAHARLLVEDIKYKDANGKKQVSRVDDKTKQILTDWVNYATGHELPPWLGRSLSDRNIALMRSVHKNLGTGILGGNVRSFAIQPSAAYNAYIEFGAKWAIRGAARFMHGGRSEARRISQHLPGRSFTVEVAEDVGQATAATRLSRFWKKVTRGSTIGIRWLDAETADLAWNIAYAKAIAPQSDGGLGLSGKKAIIFADDATIRGQGSASRMDVSPIQWTPEGRLLTMFQTFPIAQWNMFIKHGFGINNKDMSTAERARRIFRMVFGAIVVNALFEGLLDMRSPLPAPEWKLLEGIKQGKSWSAIMVDMVTEPLESVPIIGGSLRYGTERKSYLPAPIQTAQDLFQLFAKGKRAVAERDFSILKPENLSAPLKVLGVPGVSQAEKMMRRRQQGGTWPQAIIGTKMETLGTDSAGLSKADKELLKKYGLGAGASKADKKKSQKAIDDLMKKYGIKK